MSLVLAHRGASAYAPENTLAAFRLAREMGADGIELDVQLTRDMVPVVIHDETVNRTADGQGTVTEMTIGEIARLDAGSWQDERFRGEQIPTLAQVFDALSDWLKPSGRARPCLINVELKTERVRPTALEREVLNVIARFGVQDRILLSSFNPLSLYRARKINPRIPRGLLYDNSLPIYFRNAWFRFLAGPQAMHPEYPMIDERYMQWANSKRLTVNTWTVDDPRQAIRLSQLGVNAIITNVPDIIKGAFA
ncbi:MAG: glycerophosphodiester phosphodiesterase [Anaerolineae bacterium]|nr:glycerophosphodiester phosphodiesterase [Anaerolineae bacterium]